MKKSIVLILIAAIAFNFAFLPLTALAQTVPKTADTSWAGQMIGWLAGETLLFTSSAISMLLGGFFGLIIGLEAKIIDFILSPSNFSFTNSTIVTLGWGITRDLANMFFILILLAIAFATVLKIQSYAIKQLWWKVIVAALLINFSLVIAGFVIDFTQVLTQFFLKQITGGGGLGTITTKLAASMQILNFYNPAPPTSALSTGGLAQFSSSAFAATVGIILTLVGLVITAFAFGAAAIFLIVRILYIWGLLIFAPVVWMLWILPATSGYFHMWWNKFIQWSFFAPIYVFMIYLSLSIFDAQGKLNPKVFGPLSIPGWNDPAPGLTTVGMPSAIFQWILVIAMMFGSLIVAQKFGVMGAKAISGATKGAAKAAGLSGIKTYGRMTTGLGTAAAGVGAGAPRIVRAITAPIRGIGRGLNAVGGVATGVRGGRFTAPLKSTPNNPLKAIFGGAIKGSGLWKADVKDWQCSFHPAVQVKSKKKPTFACPQATTTPPLHPLTPADWIEV